MRASIEREGSVKIRWIVVAYLSIALSMGAFIGYAMKILKIDAAFPVALGILILVLLVGFQTGRIRFAGERKKLSKAERSYSWLALVIFLSAIAGSWIIASILA